MKERKHPMEILRKNIEKDDEILRALSRGKKKYLRDGKWVDIQEQK